MKFQALRTTLEGHQFLAAAQSPGQEWAHFESVAAICVGVLRRHADEAPGMILDRHLRGRCWHCPSTLLTKRHQGLCPALQQARPGWGQGPAAARAADGTNGARRGAAPAPQPRDSNRSRSPPRAAQGAQRSGARARGSNPRALGLNPRAQSK